jgi:hypothetical protein
MTGPVPEGDGYTGYSESGDIPFSVRPGEPEIASGRAAGVYYPPSPRQQENIVLDPEGRNPRFTAAHELGHAVHMRDPKGEIGWLSPELRKAMESGEAPFDTEGYYSTDEPGQRVADYIGDAINFLQTSKDPTIDPEYTRQFLSDRPHLQRVTEELLQIPIYQEHPFLTGSLGEAYEPETELPETGLAGVSYSNLMGRASDGGGQSLNPVTGQHEGLPDISSWEKGRIEEERIDELVRRIDMGMGGGFQEGDTDAIWDAVSERLDAMKQRKGGESYTSRFLPAS